MEQLTEWLEYLRPATPYVTAVLLCCVSCLVYDLLADRYRQRRKRVKMSAKERKKVVKDIICDKLCDALEDLYYSDKITRDERDEYYVMIGSRCNLPGLLPKYKVRHPHPEDLKEAIKDRLDNVPTIMRLHAILNRGT